MIFSNDAGPGAEGDEASNVEDQKGWSALSPDFEQVVVDSGHDVPVNEPELVVNKILEVSRSPRRLTRPANADCVAPPDAGPGRLSCGATSTSSASASRQFGIQPDTGGRTMDQQLHRDPTPSRGAWGSRRSVSHRRRSRERRRPYQQVVMSLASGPKSCGPVSRKSARSPCAESPPVGSVRIGTSPTRSTRRIGAVSGGANRTSRSRRSPAGTAYVWSVEPSRESRLTPARSVRSVGPGGRSAVRSRHRPCVSMTPVSRASWAVRVEPGSRPAAGRRRAWP